MNDLVNYLITMFGKLVDLSEDNVSMSDEQLEHLYKAIKGKRLNSRDAYEFVRDLFDMIEDQYAYRNHMMGDEDMSEPESEIMSDDSEPIKESYTSFYMK